MSKFLSFIFLIWLTSTTQTFAQIYNFRYLSVLEGMPLSQITSVCQDKQGNLWFGTYGAGVCKYDGNSFSYITTKDGLLDNTVFSIYCDSKEHIWIGTTNGVTRYIPPYLNLSQSKSGQELAQLKKIVHYKDSAEIPLGQTWGILEDKKGNYWFRSRMGLCMLSQKHASNSHLKNHQKIISQNIFKAFGRREGLNDSLIYTMVMDDFGNIYFSTRTEIYVVSNIRKKGVYNNEVLLPTYFQTIKTKGLFTSNNALFLTRDQLGNILIFNKTELITLDPMATLRTGKAVFHSFKRTSDLDPHLELSDLKVDSRGYFWISSRNRGAYKFLLDRQKSEYQLEQHLTTDNGLKVNDIISFMEDKEHNIWLCSSGSGAIQYSGNVFETYTESQGLKDDFIFPLVEDYKNRIWVGSYTGLSILEKDKLNQSSYNIKSFGKQSNIANSISRSMSEDYNGNIWLSTSLGLLKFNPDDMVKGGKATVVTLNNSASGGLVNDVRTLYLDSKKNLWIALDLQGVRAIKRDQQSQDKFDINGLYSISSNQSLPNELIYDINEDQKGNIWIAHDKGVSKIINGIHLPNDPKIENISKKDGLIQNIILQIQVDSKGNLWLCTEEGISKISFQEKSIENAKNYTITNYTTDNGLSSNMVYFCVFDAEGNPWFGTNKGIDQFIVDRQVFRNFGRTEGFTSIETNQKSALRDNQGNLWFGTIGGLIKYNPKEEHINFAPTVTNISKLQLFFKDIDVPDDHTYLYNQNYMTFHYIGVTMTIPEKVKYKYRLIGLNEDWSPETKETRASFTNLPSGNYSFQVKASNNNGLWNEKPTVYTFTITPPFWQTWWFYTICIFIACGIFYLFIKYRELKLRREKIVLENRVLERTAEINRQKVEIAEKATILSDQNLKITQSINYAETIQSAILPDPEYMSSYLPHHFVYFQPKDIVSGDFYWFVGNEQDAKKECLIAAVDCTGHGVPGAMMSMMGFNLLNQALENSEQMSPSNILNNLSQNISGILSGNGKPSISDGMDISICHLNLDSLIMRSSGAQLPIYVVSKDGLKIVESDIMPIGMSNAKKDFKYKEQVTQLSKGEKVYLFSDGYADQFGGPKNRKFMRAQFQSLLLSICNEPMADQERILSRTILDWKGSNKQIDDMLVIGFGV